MLKSPLTSVLKADGGLYKLGTRTGVLLGQYTLNQFQPWKKKFWRSTWRRLEVLEPQRNKKVKEMAREG